jgi:hypothetical protein
MVTLGRLQNGEDNFDRDLKKGGFSEEVAFKLRPKR